MLFFFAPSLPDFEEDVNIEGGEQRAGRPQQDSPLITAVSPSRIAVYCESKAVFL